MSDTLEQETEEVLGQSLIKRAAALAIAGATTAKMATELKISRYAVEKLKKDEKFRQLVTEIGEDAVAGIKASTRAAMAKLQGKALLALERNLDRGSMEAVKTWLKAIGLDQEKEGQGDQGGFTLVLANQKPDPKTVEVKREE